MNNSTFPGRENNFEKAQSSLIDNQGIGYDYRSVMHYSANAFSRNGQATIDPKVYFLRNLPTAIVSQYFIVYKPIT